MRFNKLFFLVIGVISMLYLCSTTEANAQTFVMKPEFSVPGGLYQEEFNLILTTKDSHTKIYYTINGSEPLVGSDHTYEYTGPITISYKALRDKASNYYCGTVIRAITVSEDGQNSEVVSSSYFLDKNIFEKYRLPIISIVTDQENLFNAKNGIMYRGNTQRKGREWERPIHLEYFDKEGKLQINMNAGMRLHGAASRDWDFKSFRIYARSDYDSEKNFYYNFFEHSIIAPVVKNGDETGKQITKFKRLILRNGGNDGAAWDGTFIRDILAQSLMANTNLDLQAYSPVVTFLNGEFYGIHNIQERMDEKYIETHYNVKEEDVVIYEFSINCYDNQGEQHPEISNGDIADLDFYNNLYQFIRKNDLSIQENYEQVKQWMDIENYVDYLIMNVYTANGDWPGNNVKAWRVRTDYSPDAEYGMDGRLRWLVFDLDFAFGLYDSALNITKDSLMMAIKQGGKEWPNPDGSTVMFRKLLHNDEFQTYFCQRYLDLINTNYNADYNTKLVDQLSKPYQVAINEYIKRYQNIGYWYANLNGIKSFLRKRGDVCRTQLQKRFSLGEQFVLEINEAREDNQPIGGKIIVNTVEISASTIGMSDGKWEGTYYRNLPTMIQAVPDEGYEFVSWSDTIENSETSLDISLVISMDSSILSPDENRIQLTPVFRSIVDDKISVDNLMNIMTEGSGLSQNMIYILFSIIILIVFIIIILIYQKTQKK